MTNNLGRNEVTAAQNQKEVTINESDGFIDSKLTELITLDFTAGDVTLTTEGWQRNGTAVCTNVVAARLLNTPQQKGFLLVDNTAGANNVTVTRGSGTVEVPASEVRFVYQDGTIDGIVNAGGGGGITLEDYKDSVRVATVAAGTLATDFENGDTIDGVVLATDDRILIKDQASGAENGIYTVNATGAPTRAEDFDEDDEVTAGALVPVEEGTANEDKLFILSTNNPITVGVTALTFSEISGGGGSTTFTGLTDTPANYTGQAGKVAKVNQAEDAIVFEVEAAGVGSGGGMLDFVETVEVTGAAQIDVPLPDNELIVLIGEVTFATDAVILQARTTVNNFSTVDSGATDYQWTHQRIFEGSTSWTGVTSAGAAEINVTHNNMGNVAGERATFMMRIVTPQDATYKTQIYGETQVLTSFDAGPNTLIGFGMRDAAQAVNGVRLFASSGNITSKVHVFKLRIQAPISTDYKESVRAATTVNGALATAYENGDTIDGVVLATGDRILLKDQTTGSENGIYTVNATGAPTRAVDFDDDDEVSAGAQVYVEEGTANAKKVFHLVTTGSILIGTTVLTFEDLETTLALGTAAFKNTGVSGDTVPLLNGLSPTFSNAQAFFGLNVNNTNTNTAQAGPFINVRRTGFNGVDNMTGGLFNFVLPDDVSTERNSGAIQVEIADATAATFSSRYSFTNMQAGSLATRMTLEAGLFMAGATGGDPGVGKINATEVQDDGTPLCAPLNPNMTQQDWDALVPNKILPERYDYEEVENKKGVKTIKKAIKEPEREIKTEHRTAKLWFSMVKEGFNPHDPEAYVARMEKDQAVPGLPTIQEWKNRMFPQNSSNLNKISIAERDERLNLALDCLAVAYASTVRKVKELEKRLEDLEAIIIRSNGHATQP